MLESRRCISADEHRSSLQCIYLLLPAGELYVLSYSSRDNDMASGSITILHPDLNVFIQALNSAKEEVNTRFNAVLSTFNTQFGQLTTNIRVLMQKQDEIIKQLQDKIVVLEAEIQSVKDENSTLAKMINDVSDRLDDTVDHGLRLNLIFYQIKEEPTEKYEDVIGVARKFMTDKLKIDANTVQQFLIRDCHRLGVKSSDKIRPIIIAFTRMEDRNLVLSGGKNLKFTDYSIQPHLSKRQQEVKKMLLVKRAIIKKKDKRILAILAYRAYKPVLLVKVGEKLVEYKDTTDLSL